VCGVGEYPCLFAEMRRVKNNKELPSFEMFGGCPLFVSWKGEEGIDEY
jgi:hypothetical protein